MWYQFILENFHFAISLFKALAFFAVFWLYFDAWLGNKTIKESFKVFGFLALASSAIAEATIIETGFFQVATQLPNMSKLITMVFSISGYLFLLTGLLLDPVQAKPSKTKKLSAISLLGLSSSIFPLLVAPLAAGVAWQFMYHAISGLENHLKKVSYAFFILALHETLESVLNVVSSTNIAIITLLQPFGVIWFVSQLLSFLAAAMLFHWAFSYLLKRINTQLFIIFTSMVISIFLLTTLSFTFLLLRNLQNETLTRIEADTAVMSFAIDAKKSESAASASLLAEDKVLVTGLVANELAEARLLAEKILISRRESSVIVVNADAVVLARGEDRERFGDSLSEDTLVKRALIGEAETSVMVLDGAVAPTVFIRAAAPIRFQNQVLGAVIVSRALDNTFLDGMKKQTGLEAGVYASNVLTASTIFDNTGSSRPVGILENNPQVKESVLLQGQSRSLVTSILNNEYFASYQPLRDVDNQVMGMIFVGRPASSLFLTVGNAIKSSFVVAAALISLSIVPTYFISKYLTDQLN